MTKKQLLSTLILLAAPAAATGVHAAELRMTVEKPHFTCEGRGTILGKVAYVPGEYKQAVSDEDAPLPCCDGQIGCAQFLSTSTVLHPGHALRG